MSYHHVQQLDSVEGEYDAARAGVMYVERIWHQLGNEPEMSGLTRPQMRRGLLGLEATYVVKLFSRFEALLQEHLDTHHPRLRVPTTAEALINRVALRARIPDPFRDAAQAVRLYRNIIVHHRARPAASMSFREVAAALNRFLTRLPDGP